MFTIGVDQDTGQVTSPIREDRRRRASTSDARRVAARQPPRRGDRQGRPGPARRAAGRATGGAAGAGAAPVRDRTRLPGAYRRARRRRVHLRGPGARRVLPAVPAPLDGGPVEQLTTDPIAQDAAGVVARRAAAGLHRVELRRLDLARASLVRACGVLLRRDEHDLDQAVGVDQAGLHRRARREVLRRPIGSRRSSRRSCSTSVM